MKVSVLLLMTPKILIPAAQLVFFISDIDKDFHIAKVNQTL
jgi:hypothetical protein